MILELLPNHPTPRLADQLVDSLAPNAILSRHGWK